MIRNTTTSIATLTLSLGVIVTAAWGQKGTGESAGIARQAETPEVVSLSGTVLEVNSEPCKMTTGRADKGTHLVLQTSTGEKLDVHLGPEADVRHVSKKLTVDQTATVKAFRTQRLPEDAYLAQSVTIDDETIRLRDDDLRPVWAGGSAIRTRKGRRGGRFEAPVSTWALAQGWDVPLAVKETDRARVVPGASPQPARTREMLPRQRVGEGVEAAAPPVAEGWATVPGLAWAQGEGGAEATVRGREWDEGGAMVQAQEWVEGEVMVRGLEWDEAGVMVQAREWVEGEVMVQAQEWVEGEATVRGLGRITRGQNDQGADLTGAAVGFGRGDTLTDSETTYRLNQ